MLIRRFREADAEKVSAMIAQKLKQGDEIRVIAPSRSLAAVWVEKYEKALAYLESQGFKVTAGRWMNGILQAFNPEWMIFTRRFLTTT